MERDESIRDFRVIIGNKLQIDVYVGVATTFAALEFVQRNIGFFKNIYALNKSRKITACQIFTYIISIIALSIQNFACMFSFSN